jgi:hypothetical protein
MEPVTQRNFPRLGAAALLVVVGLGRGLGGLAMVFAGTDVLGGAAASDALIRIAGVVAFILAGCVFVAGVLLIRGGQRLFAFAAASIILLFLDGIGNGWLLFGAPRLRGQLANAAVAMIILVLLGVARAREGTA